jgi:hypothetical protein
MDYFTKGLHDFFPKINNSKKLSNSQNLYISAGFTLLTDEKRRLDSKQLLSLSL